MLVVIIGDRRNWVLVTLAMLSLEGKCGISLPIVLLVFSGKDVAVSIDKMA